VVAEDEIEPLVREGELLGARAHQRESDTRLGDVGGAGGELLLAEVQPDDVRASHRDLDAELTGAAAELERVSPFDVSERMDVVLRHVPRPPPEPIPAVQLRGVPCLVFVAVCLPAREIGPDVVSVHLRAHRSSHPPSRSCACATRPAAIDRAISSGARPPRSSPRGDRILARSSSAKPDALSSST
jgi:hypothetical protein